MLITLLINIKLQKSVQKEALNLSFWKKQVCCLDQGILITTSNTAAYLLVRSEDIQMKMKFAEALHEFWGLSIAPDMRSELSLRYHYIHKNRKSLPFSSFLAVIL